MNKVKYTEWIDQYMEGALDEGGSVKFEQELKVNPQLVLEYRLEQDIHTALKDTDILDFRAICMEAQEEVKLTSSRGTRVVQLVRKYWYAAASLVIVALIAGAVFFLQEGTYSNEKLFKMYYKSGDIGIKRSGSVNMVEALMAYSQEDFATAARAFEQVLSNDPGNIPVMYYCAISNIETANYKRSIQLFSDIISQGDNSYVEYAEWNLGLTYLADDQEGKAISQFETIAKDSKHSYYQQAVSIMEKLGENKKNEKIFNNLFFLILPF
jgi:tetratricopeptide (TPR) repeat protein